MTKKQRRSVQLQNLAKARAARSAKRVARLASADKRRFHLDLDAETTRELFFHLHFQPLKDGSRLRTVYEMIAQQAFGP